MSKYQATKAIVRDYFDAMEKATPDTVADVLKTDPMAELQRLGLNDHLSAQRSNGLRAMVQRIHDTAAAAAR